MLTLNNARKTAKRLAEQSNNEMRVTRSVAGVSFVLPPQAFVPAGHAVVETVKPKREKRLPGYPWKQTRDRIQRLQEQELKEWASKIPDAETLDAIMSEYDPGVRSRVMARIFDYLPDSVVEELAAR